MKIVVLDGHTLNPGDLSWKEFEKLGDLTVYDRTPDDLIVERIGDAEIVFTNKTSLSKAAFDACSGIKWVGVLATGYNVVDIQTAKVKGIPVCNVPSYSTAAVAQMVFALLLELCHHVGEHDKSVKDGKWSKNQDFCYWDYPLIELAGKTMGIIGLGRIGKNTANITNAFGMNVLAYAEHKRDGVEHDMLKYTSLDTLFAESDVISLHCPLFESTKGIINKNSIAKMKDGVMIINTARGLLIVEEDLKAALNSGKVAGAACDVVSEEPIDINSPLLHAKNIIITPHIAWAPKESRERLLSIAADNLKMYIKGTLVNCVNM